MVLRSIFGPQRRVVLVDWHNVVWRAMSVASEPEAFLKLLLGMLAKYRKTFRSFSLVVALEGSGADQRRKLWPAYKAGRAPHEAAGELLGLAESVLGCLAGTVIRAVDGEADDAIASYLARHIGAEDRAVVVSEDKDLWACVRDPAVTVHCKQGEVTAAWVQHKLGVPPAKVPLLKALRGDSSDNLPPVAGLKRAAALAAVNRASTLSALLKTPEDAVERCKKQIRCNYEVALLRADLNLTERVQRAKPNRLRNLLRHCDVYETIPNLKKITDQE